MGAGTNPLRLFDCENPLSFLCERKSPCCLFLPPSKFVFAGKLLTVNLLTGKVQVHLSNWNVWSTNAVLSSNRYLFRHDVLKSSFLSVLARDYFMTCLQIYKTWRYIILVYTMVLSVLKYWHNIFGSRLYDNAKFFWHYIRVYTDYYYCTY